MKRIAADKVPTHRPQFRGAMLYLVLCVANSIPGTFASEASPQQSAETVLTNGRIYTVDADRPWAEAVAIRGGKYLYVGDAAGVKRFIGTDTRRIDLQGKFAMPGVNDGHLHPAWGGVKELFQCNFPFSATPDDIATKIAECVAAQPDSDWIQGGQWTSDFFVNHSLASPRKWLDKVSGDKAVILSDDSGHNHWANSRALQLIGIDRDTPDPAGGRIVKNPVTGEPNGVLEEAYGMIGSALPPWTTRQYVRGAAYSVEQANRYGVTGMKDASASAAEVEAFYTIDQAEGLTVHVAAALFSDTEDKVTASTIEEYVRLRDRFRSSHVHTNFVKLFLDGVPTASRSAAMLAPYLPETEGDEENHGPLLIEPQDLANAVVELDRLGFTLKIHAAGDRSVRVGLDAIERARNSNGDTGLRHELAHAGYIDPDDIPRFARLNVVADFSPYIWFPSPIMDSINGALGERSQYYWPARDLLDNKAPMLAGSDWPSAVPDMNPWRGMEALVTRGDPLGEYPGTLWKEQAISLEEALMIYTLEGAKALKLEQLTGSVVPGKSADLIVLHENLFEIPASRIADTRVMMTLFEGELVYSDPAAAQFSLSEAPAADKRQ